MSGAMPAKCTYPSCHRHFDSDAAMIKHKKKDPEHAYCSKCDIDCDDDMHYMIHQIESSRHICCPVCGVEFKSTGGRDRHVEINHASAQRIACRGCKIVFTRASSLMRHIETQECKVITLKDFQRERAERAINRDYFEQQLNANDSSTIIGSAVNITSPNSSEADDEGGVSLLYSTHPGIARDAQDQAVRNIIEPTKAGPYRPSLPQASGDSITALNKFPVLPTNTTSKAIPKQDGDLLDFNIVEERVAKLSVMSGVWNEDIDHSKNLFPAQDSSPPTPQTDSKYDNLSEVSFHSDGSGSRVPTYLETANSTGPSEHNENVPPAAPPTNNDPSAPYGRVQTAIQWTKGTTLDIGKYWEPVREAYECPGVKCAQLFKTPESFRDHLLSGTHVSGDVTCPSCLNRFRTNSALISHMESGGKRCNIRNSANYNQVLREVTAGLIGTSGHLEDGTVRYTAPVDEGWDFSEKKNTW